MILHSARNKSRAVITAFASLCISLSVIAIISTVYAAPKTPKPDAAASGQAFLQVYKVFTSPRCQNCHPAGDAPLQGDDSHVHMQNVKRAKTATASAPCVATLATRPQISPVNTCRPEIPNGLSPLPNTRWFLSDVPLPISVAKLEILNKTAIALLNNSTTTSLTMTS